MPKKITVKRQDHSVRNREPISSGGITLTVDPNVADNIASEQMNLYNMTTLRRIKIGFVDLIDEFKDLSLSFRDKGYVTYAYHPENMYKAKAWSESMVEGGTGVWKGSRRIFDDFSRDCENLVDQVSQPKAYPDGSVLKRTGIYFIGSTAENLDEVKKELLPLLQSGDIIFQVCNKQILLTFSKPESKTLELLPLEIPFSCLSDIIEALGDK
tara:strand:- start:47 stop:682 length:636 start_codon:yes stop_codon:yes gene_type:complete